MTHRKQLKLYSLIIMALADQIYGLFHNSYTYCVNYTVQDFSLKYHRGAKYVKGQRKKKCNNFLILVRRGPIISIFLVLVRCGPRISKNFWCWCGAVLRFEIFFGAARCGAAHRTEPPGASTNWFWCVDP